jgi:hypothetical protein
VAVDFTSFVVAFPAFRNTDRPRVEVKIAEAKRQVDEAVWGELTDDGVGYLAAHLLAIMPGGEHARLIPRNAKPVRGEALTTYEREYKRLMRQVASGFRVTGPDQTAAAGET